MVNNQTYILHWIDINMQIVSLGNINFIESTYQSVEVGELFGLLAIDGDCLHSSTVIHLEAKSRSIATNSIYLSHLVALDGVVVHTVIERGDDARHVGGPRINIALS